jgi:nickel-type superoxide dismutase maturation protease
VLAVLGAAVRRAEVTGDSMVPTLAPGDRLLVLRLGHRKFLRPGSLVMVAAPPVPGRPAQMVKRLVDHHGSTVAVVGDNPDASTDSRSFGRLPLRSVTGLVFYRYAPAERTGAIGLWRGPFGARQYAGQR